MVSPTLGFVMRGFAALVLLGLVSALPVQAQPAGVKDVLGIPGPISLDGESYALAWSSQPSPSYRKQEYLPAGQQLASYTQMVMVEAMTGGATIQDAVAIKVDMLKQRKATDPLVNYDVIRNDSTGDMMLDFIMSDRSTGTLIVEWNAYRYTKLDDGVALFAVSRRGYGDQAKAFLVGLKSMRPKTINALAKLTLPAVVPAD